MTVGAAQLDAPYFIKPMKVSLTDYDGMVGKTTIKVKLKCDGKAIAVQASIKVPTDRWERPIPFADIVWCNPDVTPKLLWRLDDYLTPKIEVVKLAAGRTGLKISFPSPKTAVPAPLAAKQEFDDYQDFDQALIQRIEYEVYCCLHKGGSPCDGAKRYAQKIGRSLGLCSRQTHGAGDPMTMPQGAAPPNSIVLKYIFYRSVLKIGRYFERCAVQTVGPDDLATLQEGASRKQEILQETRNLLQSRVKQDQELSAEERRRSEIDEQIYAKAIAAASAAPAKLMASLFGDDPQRPSILRAAFLVQDRQGRMRFRPANALNLLISLTLNGNSKMDVKRRLLQGDKSADAPTTRGL